MQELLDLYKIRKKEIKARISDFKNVWKDGDERIFEELCFCLFTPQSKAEACWDAVLNLKRNNLLHKGDPDSMKQFLHNVRFYKTKSRRVIEARKHKKIKKDLENLSPVEAREWIVKNVNGMGYKEASHFLRNIGFADELMILDRHILKNLVNYGVIQEIPNSMTPKRYFEIEEKMKKFSDKVGIPGAEMDILLWSKETGKVFK